MRENWKIENYFTWKYSNQKQKGKEWKMYKMS